jgi:hypothetical protein
MGFVLHVQNNVQNAWIKIPVLNAIKAILIIKYLTEINLIHVPAI